MPSLKTELNAEPAQELEQAERELQAALIFAKYSYVSYSNGRLQRATDARSKAAAACRSAAQRLAAPELAQSKSDSVKSIWNEVQTALADLPAANLRNRVRRAGS